MVLYAWCYKDDAGCMRVVQVSDDLGGAMPLTYLTEEAAMGHERLLAACSLAIGKTLELRRFTASEFDNAVLARVSPETHRHQHAPPGSQN